jgi:hypothetical protein
MAAVQPHNLPVAAVTIAPDNGELPMAMAEVTYATPSIGAAPAVCVTAPAVAPVHAQVRTPGAQQPLQAVAAPGSVPKAPLQFDSSISSTTQMAAVETEMRRFNEPPKPDGKHWDSGETFFFRYVAGSKGWTKSGFPQYKPFSDDTFCQACCCPCVSHGRATKWATGRDETVLYCLCPLYRPCLFDRARRNIEAKIHDWHQERGDPRAAGEPNPMECHSCGFLMCCEICMLAQNVEAGLVFDAHQKSFRVPE